MHVGASLRLLLLVLLHDASPTAPGARIQGDPLLPPCGTRDPFGRALGDPMHPGVGELQLRSPGGTVGQGDPIARDPRRSLVELRRLLLFPAIILCLSVSPAIVLITPSPTAISCDMVLISSILVDDAFPI